jgi:hypothetical protein
MTRWRRKARGGGRPEPVQGDQPLGEEDGPERRAQPGAVSGEGSAAGGEDEGRDASATGEPDADTLVKLRTALENKINNILSAHGINLEKEALSSEKKLREKILAISSTRWSGSS